MANPIAISQTAYTILFLMWCNVCNTTYTAVKVIIVSNINALIALLSAGSVRGCTSISIGKELFHQDY